MSTPSPPTPAPTTPIGSASTNDCSRAASSSLDLNLTACSLRGWDRGAAGRAEQRAGRERMPAVGAERRGDDWGGYRRSCGCSSGGGRRSSGGSRSSGGGRRLRCAGKRAENASTESERGDAESLTSAALTVGHALTGAEQRFALRVGAEGAGQSGVGGVTSQRAELLGVLVGQADGDVAEPGHPDSVGRERLVRGQNGACLDVGSAGGQAENRPLIVDDVPDDHCADRLEHLIGGPCDDGRWVGKIDGAGQP